jgi:hypothetical protein
MQLWYIHVCSQALEHELHVHPQRRKTPVLLPMLLLQEMLCIEPAVAGSGPYKLAPGQTWSGSQTLVYKAG